MARPRRQTYTLEMYLKKIKDGDISNDADVQRRPAWKNEHINELLHTVLMDDYIPPLILGEEPNSQLHIADGGCRSDALMRFRYMNYKITSSIESPVIIYNKKVKSEDGSFHWEEEEFNLKNCTYEKLPEELKKRFNEYQIETVIHENCDRHMISKYIKIYNNHISMNVNQKSFCCIENFATEIRYILESKFFNSFDIYTENDYTKGVMEKVVMESVMCMFHYEKWKKQLKQIGVFLNNNATFDEFEIFSRNIGRLEKIYCKEMNELFIPKNAFIWFTIFHKFTEMNIDDQRFADFLKAFNEELKYKKIDDVSFMDLEDNRGTRDKSLITSKLNLIENLMMEYLDFDKEDLEKVDALKLVNEMVDPEVTEEDVECYKEDLEVLTLEVDNDSRLLDERNRPSLIAMIAIGYKEDISIDSWFMDYFNRVDMFTLNQKKNFTYMLEDLNDYMSKKEVA